jgi:hypothetical protein
VFDGDRLAGGGRRLVWGGVIFGFGGAVESWAIVPVLVVVLLSLATPAKTLRLAAGVAAGFLVPVLPFFALSARRFYESVFVAQLVRYRQVRVPLWTRLNDLTGLSALHGVGHPTVLITTVALTGFVVATAVAASLVTHRPPPPLEWFGMLTAGLVVAAFMWPPGFFFHFPAFLAPFLALALALPVSRLLPAGQPLAARYLAGHPPAGQPRPGAPLPGHPPTGQPLRDQPTTGRPATGRPAPGCPATGQPPAVPAGPAGPGWAAAGWIATATACLVILVFAGLQASTESAVSPRVGPAAIAAARRAIPPGACVLTDQVSFTIAANRFTSDVPGCPEMIDPLGTDLALTPGRDGLTGAGRNPAVAAIMRQAFGHAQYVWLAGMYNRRRIAWSPSLRAYFRSNFTRVLTDNRGDALYVRNGLHHPAR